MVFMCLTRRGLGVRGCFRATVFLLLSAEIVIFLCCMHFNCLKDTDYVNKVLNSERLK
jgi:hypothetical protein